MTTEIFRQHAFTAEVDRRGDDPLRTACCWGGGARMWVEEKKVPLHERTPSADTVWERIDHSCHRPVQLVALSATVANARPAHDWIERVHGTHHPW